MDKSKELINENFNFIIVDDDRRKIALIRGILERFEAVPYIITDSEYFQKTLRATYNSHYEGKYPVIFLDEDLGKQEILKGRDIVVGLTNVFEERGGVILPLYPSPQQQLDSWSEVEIKNDNWHIEKDVITQAQYVQEGEIERVCTEFLSNIDSKEQDSEIKNG